MASLWAYVGKPAGNRRWKPITLAPDAIIGQMPEH